MKTEYDRPGVVMLVYAVALLVGLGALLGLIMAFGSDNGASPIVLFLPAAVIALIGYALELLSRILHEAVRIREKLEGPVTVVPREPGDMDYFLEDHHKSTGPFPLKVLLNRLRMGTLPGSAQVQLADTTTWVALETLQT